MEDGFHVLGAHVVPTVAQVGVELELIGQGFHQPLVLVEVSVHLGELEEALPVVDHELVVPALDGDQQVALVLDHQLVDLHLGVVDALLLPVHERV